MLTSLFSHRSLVHVITSSMLVAAFGSATAHHLFEAQSEGADNLREATPKWHFLAFFISAGVFANLVSHVAYSRITYPRLVARLRSLPPTTPGGTSATTPRSFLAQVFRPKQALSAQPSDNVPPGFGASGVVYATLAFAALAYPDTVLAMQIPPTFPLPIQYAVGSLLVLDVIGIWRAWRRFNHWAHLGGAAFGAFYWAYGPQAWEFFREAALGGLPPSLTILPGPKDTSEQPDSA
ncbi:hypothetical protein EVJ58_g3270 [Rhodofomes roseus]|uniref:Peptidase S54 rhomboid domain-containing protein n=1 Tax=Rhodofomes roseus TaxID=34475 RepID=A0A4Y9YLW3_9APHY|nr:hypothetical protein EVJ58_g3270 [Rhodofomes roseus]